ncbi:MAG: Phosphoribosyltransferase [Microgenomates group bacterium GW2011_GWA1_46_15]|nr:MAG: Phosphoribosyltransferase [Microgenomates group bacterium GW2011_GWA1_46_15]
MCEECEIGMWEEEQICPGCVRASRYGLKHVYCTEKSPLTGVTCLWAYEGIARKLIASGKYKFYYDYLRELTINSCPITVRPEFTQFREFISGRPLMVPVPLHPRRLRERGFNQAKVISLSLGLSFELNTQELLVRVKDTGRQVGRDRGKRLKAMEKAFQISPKSELSIPTNVMLVDDVWTTGATMNECARTLKQGGVKKVWGLVLAR